MIRGLAGTGVRARRAAAGMGALPRVVLGAGAAILIFARFLPGVHVNPGADVDGGWAWAMNVATARHMVFGRDIIFTYGPYAAVVSRVYDPALRGLIILGAAIPAAAFAAGLIALAEPAWLVCVVLALPLVRTIDALAFLLPWPAIFLCARALGRGESPRGLTLASVLLAVALGFLPLTKLSLLPVSIIGDGLAALLLWRLGRVRLAVALPVISVVAMTVFWVVAGQGLGALPAYFAAGSQIISGFGDAMARFGPSAHVMRAVYASVLLLGLTAWQSRKLPRVAGALLSLGLALVLWIIIKAGYVREDIGHENVALSALGGMFLIVAAWPEDSPTLPPSPRPFAKVFCFFFSKKKSFLSLFCAFLLLTWPSEEHFSPRLALNVLSDAKAEVLGSLRLLFDPAALARDYQAGKAAVPTLPWQPAGTADIYETGQAMLFASDLAWSPRPVVQSYSAYTADLIGWNVAHLLGPAAPDHVFFRPEAIDMRLPALDDGASWPALLSRYMPAGYDPATDLAWLRRDPASPAVPAPGPPVMVASVALGERVALPDAPALWARIDVRPSLAGMAAGVALKMPPLWITLDVPPMPAQRFRFIPAMGQAGFLISPLVLTAGDFLRLRPVPVPGQQAATARRPASFTLAAADGQRWAYRNRYGLSLAPMAFPPAAPPPVAPAQVPHVMADAPPRRDWVCYLDTVDDQPITSAPVSAPWPIRIRGWGVFDIQKGIPADRVALAFQGEDGRFWTVATQSLPSEGLAAFFHQAAFGHADVRADVDLAGLPAGRYGVFVLVYRGAASGACATGLRVVRK